MGKKLKRKSECFLNTVHKESYPCTQEKNELTCLHLPCSFSEGRPFSPARAVFTLPDGQGDVSVEKLVSLNNSIAHSCDKDS